MLDPPTLLAVPHTFEMVFSQFHRHPEYKSLTPDGTLCRAAKRVIDKISGHRDRLSSDRQEN